MKNLAISFILVLLLSTNTFSQVSISPNPQLKAICPEVNNTFTVSGIPADCSGFTIELQSGESTFSTETINGQTTFTVNPVNKSQNLVVTFNKGADADCPSNKTFTIPVMSVKDKVPTIYGCPFSLPAGIQRTFILDAELLYQHRGTNDPTEVASYTWSISSGGTDWFFSTINAPDVLRKTATFGTDLCSGATITVRATDHCGNQSEIATCSISRYVETPSISSAPPYVICCNQTPFPLLASQSTPGLSGYTYSWNYGTWTGFSAGNGAFVTPDGINPGNISVTANACGESSNPAKIDIPIKVIEPTTIVIGSPILGEGQTGAYKLNILPEQCGNISWNVTPSEAVVTSAGPGSEAIITATSGYNCTATITFEVSTPCGTESRSLNFLVGDSLVCDQGTNIFTIGTKWTYETRNASALSVGFDEFTIVDTTMWQGEKAFVIEPSVVDERDYMLVKDKKIYFWDKNINEYQLNYDFQNDSSYYIVYYNQSSNQIDSTIVVVDSINVDNINGVNHTIQYCKSKLGISEIPIPFKVINSIGGSYGGIRLPVGFRIENFNYEVERIRCFENDTIFYNFTEVDCDSTWIVLSTQEFDNKSLEIYPNPTNELVFIKGIDKEVEFELYGISGELIKKGSTTGKAIMIDKSGVYLLQLRIEGKWINRKIVKIE